MSAAGYPDTILVFGSEKASVIVNYIIIAIASFIIKHSSTTVINTSARTED